MDFLELKKQFENKLKKDFELPELLHKPFGFGFGMIEYRIKG